MVVSFVICINIGFPVVALFETHNTDTPYPREFLKPPPQNSGIGSSYFSSTGPAKHHKNETQDRYISMEDVDSPLGMSLLLSPWWSCLDRRACPPASGLPCRRGSSRCTQRPPPPRRRLWGWAPWAMSIHLVVREGRGSRDSGKKEARAPAAVLREGLNIASPLMEGITHTLSPTAGYSRSFNASIQLHLAIEGMPCSGARLKAN